MKKSKVNAIKIHLGLEKVARDNGLYTSVLFFLQAKCITSSGYITNFVSTYSRFYNVSQSSARNNIKKLYALKFAEKIGNKVRLISTDKFYTKLGFDMRTHDEYGNKRHIPLKKIFVTDSKKNLIDSIHLLELYQNREKQIAVIKKKDKERKLAQYGKEFHVNVSNLSDSQKRRINQQLEKLNLKKEIFLQSLELNKNPNQNLTCNYKITLSQEGMSRIFGYKSSTTSARHQKRLKDRNLIDVKNSRSFVMDCPSYEVFLSYNLGRGYFYSNGSIYKQECNDIIYLNSGLSSILFNFKGKEIADMKVVCEK